MVIAEPGVGVSRYETWLSEKSGDGIDVNESHGSVPVTLLTVFLDLPGTFPRDDAWRHAIR
jgi:hypothetical protein